MPLNVKMSGMSETRNRLIDAAIRSFVRYGVRKTTMSDIAEEAGVSRQTLYSFFRSLDDVLATAITRTTDEQLEAAIAQWAPLASLGDKLDAFFEAVVIPAYDLIKNSPDAQSLITGYNEAGSAAVRDAHAKRTEAIAEILTPYEERITQSGQSVAQLARFIVIVAVGIKYQAESKEDLLDLLSSLKVSVLALVGERSRLAPRHDEKAYFAS